MNLNSLVTLCLIISSQMLAAQNAQDYSQIRCGFEHVHLNDVDQNRAFEDWMSEKNNETIQFILSRNEEDIYKIPVIFHVLHYGEEIGSGTNLSTTQIYAQIEQVNNDLRKKEGTSGFNTYEFGADTGLELMPALFDENGYRIEEQGINRINSIEAGFGSSGTSGYSESFINTIIKPATQWNPSEYLNVWITDLSSGVLGFAQFPETNNLDGMTTAAEASTDGVVLFYKSVGSTDMPNPLAFDNPTYENYNKGRTFTHELGHWFGLKHIWGDGGCDTDDFCEDTPFSEGAYYGCPSASFSCNSEDLVENYMDYTDDSCMNIFTKDQKIRIMTVMSNSPRRSELVLSNKATPSTYIDLSTFDVRLEEWTAVINWSTLFENNNSQFILYKSTDGEQYSKLTDIDGAGISNERLEYEYIDEDPAKGTNYYKLTIMDFDGTETLIGLKKFEYYLGFKAKLSPNPTRGDLNVSIWAESGGETQMNVYDATGKKRMTSLAMLTIGRNELDLDIDQLPKGIYLIQFIQGPWRRCIKVHKH